MQSLPRRGFIVIPITAEDVREIYSLRFALERMAVELGVPVADPSRLQPLREALDDMKTAADEGDDDAVLAANSRFHLGLVALPGTRASRPPTRASGCSWSSAWRTT